MGFRDLGKSLLELGADVADRVKDRMNEHARMEDERTLFLSDWAFTGAVKTLGYSSVPDAELRAEQEAEGYRVSGKVDGKLVSALLVVRSIRLGENNLTVQVETPNGISLEARPIANFLAAVTARLFGGTWVGAKIFSVATPKGLTWDGNTARLVVDMETIPLVGKRLATVDANATIRRGVSGLLIEFDDRAVAVDVRTVLTGIVWDLLRGHLGASLRE